ncbi:RNA dependent RNA polymerase-domain-containing protein [Russula compacta]|nr:RNA dependent RNA polymerase-domain-containing protein [Russula compacta]
MQIHYTNAYPDVDGQSTNSALDHLELLSPNGPEDQDGVSTSGSSSTEGPIGQVPSNGPSMLRAPTPSLCQRLSHVAGDSTRNVDHEGAKQREQIEDEARQVSLNITNIQVGVWYRRADALPSQGRTFSIEYERYFLRNGEACIYLDHMYGLICIHMMPQANEEMEMRRFISVKFSSIRNLGIGYDEFNQPFILFDLHMPPSFNVQRTNHRWVSRARDRLSSLDDAHARVAPYAHHFRILLANRGDLLKFEKLCHISRGNCRPIRVSSVDAFPQGFFSNRYIQDVHRWMKTMDWANAFQIEVYLRCGLFNTHELLFTLQKPIEGVICDYGGDASALLRLFFVALRIRNLVSNSSDQVTQALARRVFVPPCRHHSHTHLTEGPYITRSNRVIRHYQSHDPALAECFVRVEFRDEDNLPYRWDRNVDGTWFLRHHVGRILREGFELGGRAFEFLAYSISALREDALWFVSPFRDPVEGFVNAEMIRASLGDFSNLLRTPSRYAARIAQVFTATEFGVKIRRNQWDEQDDLGPHTDGVGTISPELADMIWEQSCRAIGYLRQNRVKPSAYQFRFLGYKGVVVVDHRLEGIRLRLRESQRKFPVHDDEVAEFEIVRSFDRPDPAHLNRPLIMALEGLGVKTRVFIDLQDAVKAHIYTAGDSLEDFTSLLKKYSIGGSFHFACILDQLAKLGLSFRDTFDKRAFGDAFIGRLLHDSAYHMLRELKYSTCIPVPISYQLVGVADEGQGYIREGLDPDRVFTLKEGFIYVQRVYAVGRPPEDKICFFRNLKNVVVLPAVGNSSLASCLGGGDLDGDTYCIYFGNSALLPGIQATPANYPPSKVWTLDEDDDDATVEDIRGFIVEFMNSDKLGLLAERQMVIADQSMVGMFDERCIELARLCRTAIDYVTNGIPVEVDQLPRALIKSKPDWRRPEVPNIRRVDYYESDRALGYLFRGVDLQTTPPGEVAPLEDAISLTLVPLVQNALGTTPAGLRTEEVRMEDLHTWYASELGFICMTHGVSISSDVRLTEEEVVLGTILAKCWHRRWRRNRADRMRAQTETLVRDLRAQIVPVNSPLAGRVLRRGLRDAWAVWGWAQHHREKPFIQSFSLVALGLVLDILERLGYWLYAIRSYLKDCPTHTQGSVRGDTIHQCISASMLILN